MGLSVRCNKQNHAAYADPTDRMDVGGGWNKANRHAHLQQRNLLTPSLSARSADLSLFRTSPSLTIEQRETEELASGDIIYKGTGGHGSSKRSCMKQ